MQVEFCDQTFLRAFRAVQYDLKQIIESKELDTLQIRCVKQLKRAKVTDFVSFGPYLYRCEFLMSPRVADILRRFNTTIVRTFGVAAEEPSGDFGGYQLAVMDSLSYDMIDYQKSIFKSGNDLFGNKQYHAVADAEAYKDYLKTYLDFPEKIVLSNAFDRSLDFFIVPPSYLCISERLHAAFTDAGVTGANISATRLPVVVGS
ncbi:hypothetical protein [Hymenobacter koreensis]